MIHPVELNFMPLFSGIQDHFQRGVERIVRHIDALRIQEVHLVAVDENLIGVDILIRRFRKILHQSKEILRHFGEIGLRIGIFHFSNWFIDRFTGRIQSKIRIFYIGSIRQEFLQFCPDLLRGQGGCNLSFRSSNRCAIF